ncbi:MAG: NYN domain-containing protein [Patescibacteria group bacterium]
MFTRHAQRVAVLIDTQNMYHSAKHLHGARLAFGKVADAVADGRPIVRAIAYVAKSKTGEESSFFEALTEMGIELKVKDVQEFASGAKKADWDVGMAVDAVKLAEKVDTIILMTGDGDFVPLVEYLHGKGVIVEVAAFAESTNAQLKTVVDRFFDISTEGRQYLMGKGFPRIALHPTKDPAEMMVQNEMSEHPDAKGKKGRAGAGGTRRVKVTF